MENEYLQQNIEVGKACVTGALIKTRWIINITEEEVYQHTLLGIVSVTF